MSVLLQRIGRLLQPARAAADAPAMPLASAYRARAEQTLRRAAVHRAGAASAPGAGAFLLDDAAPAVSVAAAPASAAAVNAPAGGAAAETLDVAPTA